MKMHIADMPYTRRKLGLTDECALHLLSEVGAYNR